MEAVKIIVIDHHLRLHIHVSTVTGGKQNNLFNEYFTFRTYITWRQQQPSAHKMTSRRRR